MKKKILLLAAVLATVTGLRAQVCDTVRIFPWTENFATNFDCWEMTGSSPWTYNPYAGSVPAIYSYTPSSADRIAFSPVIALPSDVPAMRLYWDTRKHYSTPTYHVLVTTDMETYDTIYTRNSQNATGFEALNVSLAAYAGQAIRVGFLVPEQTNHATFYIVDLQIYSDSVPLGSLTPLPHFTALGDTMSIAAQLTHGFIPTPTYTWSSQMADAGLATMVPTDSILKIVYSAEGVDTVTATAANAYGSCTMRRVVRAYDCTVDLPWEEHFTFDTTFGGRHSVCWEFNNWSASNSINNIYDQRGDIVLGPGTYSTGNPAYMISPAIDIPAVGADGLALWVESTGNLQLCLSTSGAADTSLFNDTVVNIPVMNGPSGQQMFHWTVMDLSSYAGQTIHVMLKNTVSGAAKYVRTVAVKPLQPMVRFVAPTETADTVTTVYTASMIFDPAPAATLTWRSAMVDAGIATAVISGDTFYVDYYQGGVDTVSVVASNPLGADTVVRTVTVIQCANRDVPFEEDFSAFSVETSVSALHLQITTYGLYYGGPLLPECWSSVWNGHNYYQPVVISPSQLTPLNWYGSLSSNGILMEAGTYYGYDTVAYVVMPGFAPPTNMLGLVVTHLEESLTHGTLTAGYMQGGVFTPVADIPNTQYSKMDTVSYDSVIAPDARLALRWTCDTLWWGTAIENVEVILLNQDSVPPTVMMDIHYQYYDYLYPDAAQALTDTTLLVARLRYGDTTGLTYTWHSAMAAAGQAVLTAAGDSARIVYLVPGVDTLRVVATTAFGSDTLTRLQQVTGMPLAYPNGPSSVYSDEVAVFRPLMAHGVIDSLSFAWHSVMATTGRATILSSGDTLRIVYHTGGTDTLTLATTNVFGTTVRYHTVNVTGCHIDTFPWEEGFESALNGCWHFWTNNDDEWMHAWSRRTDGTYYSNSGTAYMMTQNLTGERDTTRDYLILPPVDLPDDQELSLDFHVCFWARSGLAVLVSTTGREPEDFTDTLHFERNMTWHTGSYHSAYVTRSLPLTDYLGQTVYIAFVNGDTCNGLFIDDISIRTSGQPEVSISGPSSVLSCDEAVFTAQLAIGDTTGLTYTWQSAMAAAGLATLTTNADTARIDYHAGGTDTVTVTVTNNTGTHSATKRCTVTDCEPASVPYTAALTTQNAIACWQRTSGPGNYSGSWWLDSHKMRAEHWYGQGCNKWLVSQAIAIPAADSTGYRLDWHVRNNHSRYQVLVSTSGRSPLDLFTDTLYYEAADTSWTTRSADLTPYAGQTVYVAFQFLGTYSYPNHSDVANLWLDTVRVVPDSSLAPADTTPELPDTVWYTVTVLSSDSLLGVVSGGGLYASGSTAIIEAYPVNLEVDFVCWNDSVTENPRTIVVTSDTVFTAYFVTFGGIDNIAGTGFTLYPNPATTTVTIDCGAPATVTVFDIRGHEMLRQKVDMRRTTVDVQGWPTGTYFVRVTTDNGTSTSKLTVRRK